MNANIGDGSGTGSLIQKWIDLCCGRECFGCTQNIGMMLNKCGVYNARKTEKHIEEQIRIMYPKIFKEMRGEDQ